MQPPASFIGLGTTTATTTTTGDGDANNEFNLVDHPAEEEDDDEQDHQGGIVGGGGGGFSSSDHEEEGEEEDDLHLDVEASETHRRGEEERHPIIASVGSGSSGRGVLPRSGSGSSGGADVEEGGGPGGRTTRRYITAGVGGGGRSGRSLDHIINPFEQEKDEDGRGTRTDVVDRTTSPPPAGGGTSGGGGGGAIRVESAEGDEAGFTLSPHRRGERRYGPINVDGGRRDGNNDATTTITATRNRTTTMNPMESSASPIYSSSSSVTGGGRRWKKIVVAVILLSILIIVIVDSLTNGYIEKALEHFLEWVDSHPTQGFFAFVGVYFVATVCFFPVSLLTLGGGFIFAHAFGLFLGVFLAVVAVFVGASTGAIVAFCLGRYLLRDWVATLTSKYATFSAFDAVMGEKGTRILVLMHLCPIVPFNVLNYAAGTTAVSFLGFVVALVAILPGTIVYVFLGSTAGSLVDSGTGGGGGGGTSPLEIAMIVVGLVLGIVGIAITSYYAKLELNKVTERRGTSEVDAAGEYNIDRRSDDGLLT